MHDENPLWRAFFYNRLSCSFKGEQLLPILEFGGHTLIHSRRLA